MSNRKAYLSALLSGILLGLCWNNVLPAFSLFFAFIPLLFVFSESHWHYSQVFKFGLVSFLIFHLGTVWWLAMSSFFGALTIVLLNSMGMAIVFVIAHKLRQTLGFSIGLLAFVMVWLSFEYIHYHWELSWPFMNLGNWLGQLPNQIQWYEYTGVLGGTLWILVVNIMLYLTTVKLIVKQYKRVIAYAGTSIVFLITPIVISSFIYNNYKENDETKRFLVVQPNIDPYTEKYNKSLFEKQIKQQFESALSFDLTKIDCVVFPESSFPVYLNEEEIDTNEFVKDVENELIVNNEIAVLGGFYSYKLQDKDTLFFNTAFMINPDGALQLYHKSKLVIGVEKMPFEQYFSFLKNWNLDFGGYNTSLGVDEVRRVFTSKKNNLKLAPIICYESVYGEFVSQFINKGAAIITVITNDAWWGDTPGYRQHLIHSQLRAIENRRAVVRSANTGVSCFINQKGEIEDKIEPWREGRFFSAVHSNEQLAFYTKNGDYIGVIATFSVIILTIFGFIKSIKHKQTNEFKTNN